MPNRSHARSAAATLTLIALALSGCTTSHLSISGDPAFVRAVSRLIPHPKPNCSPAEVVELSLRAEQTYTYRSNERGEWEWVTLSHDYNGRCIRSLGGAPQ